MNRKGLDVFGNILITKVRDEAIDHWERVFNGEMKDNESQEIYKELQLFKPDQMELIHELLSKVVDTTLHHLLWTLEQEKNIDVVVNLETGAVLNIRNISDGLVGELYTEDGWISRFSKK